MATPTFSSVSRTSRNAKNFCRCWSRQAVVSELLDKAGFESFSVEAVSEGLDAASAVSWIGLQLHNRRSGRRNVCHFETGAVVGEVPGKMLIRIDEQEGLFKQGLWRDIGLTGDFPCLQIVRWIFFTHC